MSHTSINQNTIPFYALIIQVLSTLLLGAAAVWGPWLADLVKRKKFAPKLNCIFNQKPPICLELVWRIPQGELALDEPVYYIRFKLENIGMSRARECEVYLEALWVYDAADKRHIIENFSPTPLRIPGVSTPVNLNPGRSVDCDIGHVFKPGSEAAKRNIVKDIPGTSPTNDPRFFFDYISYPYTQINCLVPGRYVIELSISAENTTQIEKVYFRIDWNGTWGETEEVMFRNLVITQLTGNDIPRKREE